VAAHANSIPARPGIVHVSAVTVQGDEGEFYEIRNGVVEVVA
jgi:hypothetical protein